MHSSFACGQHLYKVLYEKAMLDNPYASFSMGDLVHMTFTHKNHHRAIAVSGKWPAQSHIPMHFTFASVPCLDTSFRLKGLRVLRPCADADAAFRNC